MRLPNAAHESRPWRIREIAPDFTLEDVWALPVNGGAEDFQTLIEIMTTSLEDPANWESLPARVLWRVRDRLGGWLTTTAYRECLRILRPTRQTAEPVDGLVDILPDPAAGRKSGERYQPEEGPGGLQNTCHGVSARRR